MPPWCRWTSPPRLPTSCGSRRSFPAAPNPAAASDVGVAASAAASAIESAAINVEVNLATLSDDDARAALVGQLAGHLALAGQARQLVAEVRQEITR
jgi:formiminotetrahydrofolate cyclodeaminase